MIHPPIQPAQRPRARDVAGDYLYICSTVADSLRLRHPPSTHSLQPSPTKPTQFLTSLGRKRLRGWGGRIDRWMDERNAQSPIDYLLANARSVVIIHTAYIRHTYLHTCDLKPM